MIEMVKFVVALLLTTLIVCVQCDRSAYEPFDVKNHRYSSFDDNAFQLNQDHFDHLEESSPQHQNIFLDILQDVLKSCDQSLNEAERSINLAMNQIDSYDGRSILIDELLSNFDIKELFQLTPISWELSPQPGNSEEKDAGHLAKLSDLVETVKDACLTLPLAIPHETIFEISKEDMINSLVTWSRKWLEKLQDQLIILIGNCQLSAKCSKLLTKVIDFSMFIVEKEELSDINEALESILNLLKSESNFGQNLRSFMDLWQKFVDPERKELDTYWISEGLNMEINQQHKYEQMLSLGGKGKFGTNTGDVEIDTEILVQEVSNEFLSAAFGTKLIQDKYRDLPEKRTRLLNLVKGLSPLNIRVGGSGANFLTYDPTNSEGDLPKIKGWSYDQSWQLNSLHPKLANSIDYQKEVCEKQILKDDFSNFTMTANQWRFLVDIIKDLKSVLLFDLSQFRRDEVGSWDPTNARLIMEDEATQTIPIMWQVGNEPNSYKYEFGWSITPEETATDYRTLRNELERAYPGKRHVIVGPGVTRPRKIAEKDSNAEYILEKDSVKFLSKFLKHAKGVVDYVSWHQYYVNGRTANLSEFTSIENMNKFVKELKIIVDTRDKWAPGIPIWLTETANAYGGGSLELSMTFASTFLWLDKLGAAALGGVSMVYRQTLYGGCYGLLDRKLTPLPSYWVSVLHKQLVGQRVLLPRVRLAPEGIRIYAHCMNKDHHLYQDGAVVVFGLNVGERVASLELSNADQGNSTMYRFILSAPLGELRSRFILLNGNVLDVNRPGEVPVLEGELTASGQLVIPAKTVVFFALPQAKISHC